MRSSSRKSYNGLILSGTVSGGLLSAVIVQLSESNGMSILDGFTITLRSLGCKRSMSRMVNIWGCNANKKIDRNSGTASKDSSLILATVCT